jgi:hypothetical protein
MKVTRRVLTRFAFASRMMNPSCSNAWALSKASMTPCYGPDAKVDQIVIQNIFIDYLIQHPELRPQQGAKLMTDAIVQKFCPSK